MLDVCVCVLSLAEQKVTGSNQSSDVTQETRAGHMDPAKLPLDTYSIHLSRERDRDEGEGEREKGRERERTCSIWVVLLTLVCVCVCVCMCVVKH